MRIDVPGAGSYTTKLLVCGEAPGRQEIENKKNFIGPSGEILWDILAQHNITRSNIYITNIFKQRLPGDNIKRIYEIMNDQEIEQYHNLLWNEIEAINPNIILALGNTALEVLTGKSGIMKYRGSILPSVRGNYKVVGTIHPAAFLERQENKELFSFKQMVFLKFDINRAIQESTSRTLDIPQRNIIICRRSYDLYNFFNRNNGDRAANDIETFKSVPICTSICFDPSEAISIPLVNMVGPGGTCFKIERHERVEIFRLLAEFFIGPVKKIGQNYNFDQTIQERFGWIINNVHSDIMLKMSILYPEFPKKLAVSTSLFTRTPYYKDEGKEYNPKKDDPVRLLRYMGYDACVTKEIDDFLELEMSKVLR